MSEYCELAKNDPYHGPYHDREYGFPLTDDDALFGRLILEINQAGLSWLTILKKQEAFKNAYDGYQISKIAQYGEIEINGLLNDAGIIRNQLKIKAVIYNAQQVLQLQTDYGSFYEWLCRQNPLSREEWVQLFKRTFKFTGAEITGEFLMSIGFLPGAHAESCPVYHEILELNPMWLGGGN